MERYDHFLEQMTKNGGQSPTDLDIRFSPTTQNISPQQSPFQQTKQNNYQHIYGIFQIQYKLPKEGSNQDSILNIINKFQTILQPQVTTDFQLITLPVEKYSLKCKNYVLKLSEAQQDQDGNVIYQLLNRIVHGSPIIVIGYIDQDQESFIVKDVQRVEELQIIQKNVEIQQLLNNKIINTSIIGNINQPKQILMIDSLLQNIKVNNLLVQSISRSDPPKNQYYSQTEYFLHTEYNIDEMKIAEGIFSLNAENVYHIPNFQGPWSSSLPQYQQFISYCRNPFKFTLNNKKIIVTDGCILKQFGEEITLMNIIQNQILCSQFSIVNQINEIESNWNYLEDQDIIVFTNCSSNRILKQKQQTFITLQEHYLLDLEREQFLKLQ